MNRVSEAAEFCAALACALLLWSVGAALILADHASRRWREREAASGG